MQRTAGMNRAMARRGSDPSAASIDHVTFAVDMLF